MASRDRRLVLVALVVLALLSVAVVPAAALNGDEDERDDDEREGGPAGPIPEWWGLGGEATEAPYVGLVEVGVVGLAAGVLGYRFGKRRKLLPPKYRRYLLPTHQWTMLLATALTLPHFLFAEEFEGLGLLVGVLLAVEVASGLYGRHLHRRVIRLGRGESTPAVVGRFFDVTTRHVFGRWRQVHISLTLFTALVVVLHVVTAIGD